MATEHATPRNPNPATSVARLPAPTPGRAAAACKPSPPGSGPSEAPHAGLVQAHHQLAKSKQKLRHAM